MKQELEFDAHKLSSRGPIDTVDAAAAKLVSTSVSAAEGAIGMSKRMNRIRRYLSSRGGLIGDISGFVINTVQANNEARQIRRQHLRQYAGTNSPKRLFVMGQFESAPQEDCNVLADALVEKLIDSSNLNSEMPVTLLAMLPSNGFRKSPLVDRTMSAMHEALVTVHDLSPSNYTVPDSEGEFFDDATIVIPTESTIKDPEQTPELLHNTLTDIEHYLEPVGTDQAATILVTNPQFALPSLGVPREVISGGHSIYSLMNVNDNIGHELIWQEQVALTT